MSDNDPLPTLSPSINCNQIVEETGDIVPVPLNYILIFFLVCLSALFSGLTLGLLGLDVVGLEIIIGGDNETVKKAAQQILPIRKRGNLLLCTLLLGNVATNSLLSILMANMTSGIIGFLSSTIMIVIFGEIIPQAACSRHALYIGQKSLPLVKFFIGLLFVFAYPLSVLLDYVLGEEIGTIHSRQELLTMLQIHHRHEQLDQDTVNVMSGAIQYRDKKAEDVMTPIGTAFMLSSADKLTAKTLSDIFRSGYSRIPVYGENRNDIVGVMLTKDMIFIDPEDEVPIANFMNLFRRPFQMVWNDDKLGEVLKNLKQGRAHMAFVRGIKENGLKDNTYEIVGLITLEDVIEEILGEEIEDETDEIPQHGDIGTRERELARLILLTGRNTSSKLSFEETQAIASHLKSNVNQFKNLLSSRGIEEVSMEAMTKMISKCKVMELQRVSSYDQLTRNEPTQEDILFKKGKISNASALILSGKIGILAGKEHFHSELGAWSMIGADALRSNDGTYLPDFTAYVISDTVRVLWITKTDINHIFNEAEMPSVALAREEKRKRKLLQHTSPPPLSSSISGQSIPGIQSNGHQEQAINPLHIESFNQETKAGSENGNNGAPRTIFKGGNAYESLDDNV